MKKLQLRISYLVKNAGFLSLIFFCATRSLVAKSNWSTDTLPSKIYNTYDEAPSFPGGHAAINDFLIKNFMPPVSYSVVKVPDELSIKFIITQNGSLLNPIVIKGYGGEIDEAILKVFRQMPKWKPAKIKNQPVDAYFTYTEKVTSAKTSSPGVIEEEMPEPVIESSPHNEEQVFSSVDFLPSFPGGQTAMFEFIEQSLKYPATAKAQKKEGIVVVQVMVEPDGSISKMGIEKSVGPDCDEEAIRLIKSMPTWKPAIKNGQAIRFMHKISVAFKLNP
jgi:TonB family protein